MFHKLELKDYIRVPPEDFEMKVEDAVLKRLREKYDGFISKELGVVVDVIGVSDVKDGIIIPGDGAAYYETHCEIIRYSPELQEVGLGKIKDIADFGAFISLGPIEGMIHVSQTMDDFVSFSKEKVLSGKSTKRTLKIGDSCRARIIAVSYKDVSNPKLGLTMRQTGLGKLEWIEEDQKPKEAAKKAGAKK